MKPGVNQYDFPIAEVPGQQATREQADMFYTRYHFAKDFCSGKDVLEIACGGGQGLGYLAEVATSVTGVDIDDKVLEYPRRTYSGRRNIAVIRGDACRLGLSGGGYDVVILFDSIYWLHDINAFMSECRRVLRDGGRLLISTVNPEWEGFNPSPYATKYLSSAQLRALFIENGFKCSLYGAFHAEENGVKNRVVAVLRKLAIKMHAIPVSIKGKEILKRMFYGPVTPIPAVLHEGMASYHAPAEIEEGVVSPPYKIIYAVGSLE